MKAEKWWVHIMYVLIKPPTQCTVWVQFDEYRGSNLINFKISNDLNNLVGYDCLNKNTHNLNIKGLFSYSNGFVCY